MKTWQWETDVLKLSPDQVAKLSKDRGYRSEFVQWFSEQGWIGWSGFGGGRWCFPVHDGGRVIAAHQIPPEKEKPITYFPRGQGVRPLVIGDPGKGSPIFVFESQWDLIAALDAADYPTKPKGVYIATRGAANRLPDSLAIPEGKTLFAVMQNDPEKNGKIPAEEWLKGLREQSRWTVLRIDTPKEHEDPQAWLKAVGVEAFREGLRREIKSAREAARREYANGTDKPDILENPGKEGGISGKSGISVSPEEPDEDDSEREPDPFPAEDLPFIARRWVQGFRDLTEGRMPTALPGICCLGTLSAAIGPGIRIRSTASDDTTGANLYFLAAAESSSGKSLAYRRITKPFFAADRQIRKDFSESDLPRAKAEADQLEAEKRELLKMKSREPEDHESLVSIEVRLAELKQEMETPRLFLDNLTVPVMIRTMARQTGTCLTSLSDEAREIIDTVLGQHATGKKCDDSFFNHAWTGTTYAFDRVTDRESIVMDAPWLSALWFVQPDKLRTLAETPETFQSGFFQRLLVCDTGAVPLPLAEKTDCFPADLESAWEVLVCALISKFRRREEESPLLVLPTKEAASFLREYQNQCVEKQIGPLADLPTVAGKWGENAWRLALVLHVAENPNDPASVPLELATAQRAKRFVDWFAAQALRIVAPARENREDERASKLRLILERPKYDRAEGVTQGILANNHGFGRKEVESLCSKYPSLFERVERETTKKGGKPTFLVRSR